MIAGIAPLRSMIPSEPPEVGRQTCNDGLLVLVARASSRPDAHSMAGTGGHFLLGLDSRHNTGAGRLGLILGCCASSNPHQQASRPA